MSTITHVHVCITTHPPPPLHAGVAHPTSDSSKSKPVNRGRALLSEDWQLYMLDLVNGARASAGLYPLCLNAALNAAAQAHAEDQAAMQTMSHAGSDGSDESVRVEAAGYYDWTSLGENVAYGYDTVEDVFQGWMESPGHYASEQLACRPSAALQRYSSNACRHGAGARPHMLPRAHPAHCPLPSPFRRPCRYHER